MSSTMRVLLLVAAVVTAFWILHKIRKLKVKMDDAIFWVVFAVLLGLLGLFPELTYRLTAWMGVMSPANLIFLVVIFLLMEKVFTLSIIVSQLEEKLTVLSAEVALRAHSSERRLNDCEAAERKLAKESGCAEEAEETRSEKEPGAEAEEGCALENKDSAEKAGRGEKKHAGN